jgi:hypothetical protein
MNRDNVCTRRLWALPVFIFSLLCALLCTPEAAHAQLPVLDDYGSGTKFVIAFPDTTSNRLDSRYPNNRFKDSWNLFIYSAVNNNRVKITANGSPIGNLTLQANKFQIQEVKANPVVTRINSIESNTIMVESDFPVVIYCYAAARQGMEAWTPIPVDMWGTEYNAVAIPGQVVGQIGIADETAIPFDRSPGPAEILVMAAYDNTKVTIRPAPWQTLLDSRMPVEVTLMAGQCYQVQSVVDTNVDFDGEQVDLAGVSVRADKPVGVVSGNTRQFVRQDQQGLIMNAYKNMLIEWLAPTEQHGTEFVFLPSWDSHRPGINAPAERVSEYVRIYGTSVKKPAKETPYYMLQPGGTKKLDYKVPQDSMNQFEYADATAAYFKSADPAQAMMHSSSILQLVAKTPCFRGIPCQTFDAWAPFMVEMTPREQWPSFAPYYAPLAPAPMQHYINVVTDTNSIKDIVDESGRTFPFTRKIPGTDLIWGSQTVAAGVDHYLMAKNGKKFSGHVYGLYAGGEQYRPGRTKKKGDEVTIAGGDDSEIENPLHPCEYEEYNALSYGYPLAPLRKVLRPADSLEIIEEMTCTEKTVHIRTLNQNPVGLRSIALDPTSVDNARLVPINPAKLSDVLGKTEVDLKIVPLNPLKNAKATLIIKDRTGKTWTVTYVYEAESLKVSVDSVDFKFVSFNGTADATVTYTNELDKDVVVKEVKFTSGFAGAGGDGFEVTSTEASGPAEKPAKAVTLKKGETFKVNIRINAKTLNKEYMDSLKVILGCVEIAIPVRAETVEPLIMVNDLNFGTFIAGDPAKTMDLKVCNIGRGVVSFENLNADSVIEWNDGNFTIIRSEIDELKTKKLGPNECFTLHVTFTPKATGLYRTTARLFANTRKTKDTSAWTAVVTKPGPQVSGYDWKERWVVPGVTDNCTKNTTTGYETIIEVTNDGSAAITVQSIELVGGDATAGHFKMDSTDPATTISVGESVLPGDPSLNRLQQKVIFMPNGRPNAERSYSCNVRVVTTSLNGTQSETVENILTGIGIESHGKITGVTFDSVKFAGAGILHGTLMAHVQALPTRPLTITEVRITGGDAVNYNIIPNGRPLPTATNPWVMQPADTASVGIEFRPVVFGLKDQARVEFIGDHSFCDGLDSSAAVSGYTFTVGLQTTGIAFGPMLTCRERDGVVKIANIGSEDVTVTDVQATNNSGFFTVEIPGDLPFTLKVGETRDIPVHFAPGKIGDFSETVAFTAVDSKDSAVTITPNPVTVSGSGFILTVPAHIDRNFRAYPGNTITTPVILDQDLDSAQVNNLFIGIRYDNKMLKMRNGDTLAASLASILTGTLLEGWTVRIVESDHPEGEYLAIFTAPAGKFLTGKGALLNLRFLTYLGAVDSSKINVNILLVGKQCAKVIPTPGLARVDSVCGLNLRLIESTGFDYSLSQNKPNPFNPTTDITFSLGLDGPTTMMVYDASGKKVATLIDAVLKPGTYSVTWDAQGYPSGLYYYRIQSGDWTKTETMMLRK